MAGYTVTALALDQNGVPARFAIAVSVMDNNGLGIQNLNERNFAVRNISDDADVSVVEVHSASLPGFYRLLLRAESAAKTESHVLALVVTTPHHIAGRMPEGTDAGSTMIKVRAA